MDIINQMDFNLYKTFLTVAKTGSISRASELLYVSQPAVSKSIKQLENNLNCKLFNRTSKGVELTADAVKLMYYVETAYNTMLTGYRMLNDSTDLLTGDIRIGVPTHICTFLLSNFIKTFNENYPGIKFHIINKSTSELVDLLEKRMLDIIVDSYPIYTQRIDVEIVELMQVETCFVGDKKYRNISRGEKIEINDLFKYCLLLPTKNTSTRKELEKKLNCDLDPILEVPTTEVLLDLVKKGMGIGYVAKPSVINEINNNTLFQIHVNEELPMTRICMAYVDEFLTSAPKKFVSFLKEGIDEIIQRKKKSIRFILTKECIYNCAFCHKEGLKKEYETKISSDNIQYIYTLANNQFGITKVNLTGGEPLIRKDIIDIVKKLKNVGANITITTNGFYLDEYESLGGYVDKINISMHTLNKENYEKINWKKGSYEKVINNIKRIRTLYPTLDIVINMTLLNGINSSIDEIKKMLEFISSLKIKLKIIEIYPISSSEFVSITSAAKILEGLNFELKEKKFRKNIYTNGKSTVILEKCTCSAVKDCKIKDKNLCRINNDIYITPDLKISICRETNDEIDIYDDVINRKDSSIIKKIEESFEKMGKNC